MGSNQNLRAVTAAPHESAGRPESAQATLLSLLELAYGSKAPARAAVERALVLAARSAVPEDAGELVAFVRAHLVDLLTAEVGPRLTMALVDDLVAKVELASDDEEPQSTARPVARVSLRSRRLAEALPDVRVLLVDLDRVGRSSLARALLRTRWAVHAIEAVAEVDDALQGEGLPDVVIIDANHPSAQAILKTIVAAIPGVTVIVRGEDTHDARALLSGSGARRYDVRSREAPAEELIEAVRRAIEA